MRVFVDSNVVVSSFTSNGLSRRLLDLLVAEHEIILSPQVFEESRRIITKKFVVNTGDLDEFFRALLESSELSLPPYEKRIEVRDPDDVDILAAALKSGAAYLVTGDKDLLDVDTHGEIAIVRPRELFDLLNLKD